MRRKTTKTRQYRHQARVLKSVVMSPRIAWFSALEFLKGVMKVVVVVGVLGLVGYGIRQAIEYTFHENSDFRLQAVHLNANDVLDEESLVKVLGINLAGNIFDFDVGKMKSQLEGIHGVLEAKVERNLPGTLEFIIATRKPVAWVACPVEGLPISKSRGGLLVDESGFTYRCPEGQFTESEKLPVIVLRSDPKFPVVEGRVLEHPEYRHCRLLLVAIQNGFSEKIPTIDSIHQENEWSMCLTANSGMIATFSLGEHERQLDNLRKAMRHAKEEGYEMATINLIPSRNVPITIRGREMKRAEVITPKKTPAPAEEVRKKSDVRALLNRN